MRLAGIAVLGLCVTLSGCSGAAPSSGSTGNPESTVATPVFSLAAGTYSTTQTVTITDSTAGATIYYTTNGTMPTTSSTLYSTAITVSASETVTAIAVDSGYINSTVASAAYVISVGIMSTYAGDGIKVYGAESYSGDGGPATSAGLDNLQGVALDGSGNLYIADTNDHRIRKVMPSGIISTVAGTGIYGYNGDGGAATNAELFSPTKVALDSSGNLYIADQGNNRIRKVTPSGIISTVAGNGTPGYSGDGGAATNAQLNLPLGVAVDNSGNLYIADSKNVRIRKVTPGGIILTVAGNGTAGYSGDGGLATSAELGGPSCITVDSSANLYIADFNNQRVRKVTAGGLISTVAGNGTAGYSGDGGVATNAALWGPNGVEVDISGNLYIAEIDNDRIRKVTPAGTISTIAGNGTAGYSGDGGAATSAQLYGPADITVDSSGNVYIADSSSGSGRVRKVTYR